MSQQKSLGLNTQKCTRYTVGVTFILGDAAFPNLNGVLRRCQLSSLFFSSRRRVVFLIIRQGSP